MIKIFRHGKMTDNSIKKFYCDHCFCGFKTDEYEKRKSTNKGIVFVIRCPECGMVCERA